MPPHEGEKKERRAGGDIEKNPELTLKGRL
jgi:hypothetical protein